MFFKYTHISKTLIFFFAFFRIITIEAQPGCPEVNAGNDQTICAGSCANLTATPFATGASTSYTVSAIPYAPPNPYNSGTPILIGIDDHWSAKVTLPFNFCFFGNVYTQIVVGSNEIISFDPVSNAPGTFCPWDLTSGATIPTNSFPLNSIMLPYQDIDPTHEGSIYWQLIGTAPCRMLVVSFYEVPYYGDPNSLCASCDCPSALYATSMVVLYETTNVIEIYIQKKDDCAGWNDGYAIEGIQNATGTTAYSAPGRNNTVWTATNDAYRFTPNGAANYTTSWWQGGTEISATTTATVCPASTTTYTAQTIYTNCDASQVTVTDQMNVVVSPSPTVNISASANPICEGGSTTLTASGATTYSWSGGLGTSNPVTVSPASTTTYTVTGTTAGCTETANITVTVNPNPTVSITPSANPICAGTSTTLTAAGATTYSWSGGLGTANPLTVTPASATTYTVTGTTAGCTGTASILININPDLTVNISASANPICAGTSTTLTASGGTTYAWSGGLGTANPLTVTPASTTTYTVTGTSAGCTGTASITVNINPDLTINISASANPICPGNSTTLTASGGTTYLWSGGLGTANPLTVTPVTATTYTVTGTSAGCTGSANIAINLNPNPTISISASANPICAGNSTTLTASGGITYIWSGGLGTANPLTVIPASTTTYAITGTDINGCTGTSNIAVNVNPNPTISISASANPICEGASTTLTAAGGSTYSWSSGLGTLNPVTVTPVSATAYSVSGTDINGCTGTGNITINLNPLPTVSISASINPICAGTSTTLTAAGGNTYSWSGGLGTANPLTVTPASATTYTVTGTDINGCTGTANITVNINPDLTVNITASVNPICAGNSTTLTASGGAIYSWSGGLGTANPLIVTPAATTSYTVTGTSAGCTGTASITIDVNPLPIADAGSQQTICSGSSAVLTASGGGTYQWNTGQSTQSIIVSPSGSITTYTVTVSLNGCNSTADVSITPLNPPPIEAGPDVAICIGNSTQLNASGGINYTWSPSSGLSSTDISNPLANPSVTTTYYASSDVPVGNMIVNGDFSAGNTGFNSQYGYSINLGPEGFYFVGTNPSVCNGGFSPCPDHTSGAGNMMIVNGAGTPGVNVWCETISTSTNTNYDFSTWATSLNSGSPAILQFSINGQMLGSAFTLSTIPCAWSQFFETWNSGSNTSANICIVNLNTTLGGNDFALDDISFSPLCTSTDSVVVTVNPLPVPNTGLPQTICNGQSATLSATGGGTYQWNTGSANDTTIVHPTSTTTYTLTVSSLGCTASDNIVVNVTPNPPANAGTDQIICNGQSANLTAFGGGTYLWSNNATNQSINVSPTNTTTYSVTVTASGCSATSDVMVTVNSLPPANAGPDQAICYGLNTTLSGSGGNVYSWSPSPSLSSPNIANPIASPTSTTIYTLTVTDVNGCSATDDMSLTVYPQMFVSVSPNQTICLGQNANLLASGGTIYSWSPGTGLSSTSVDNPVANPTTTTAYNVTVNDGNGCTETAGTAVTVNSIPTSNFTVSSPICIGQTSTITYTGSGTPLSIYNWDFDGGTVISGTGSGPFQVAWPTPSSYNISLSVTENGCTSPTTSIPQIVGLATASISIIDSISCNGMNNGQVIAVPTGASPFQYNWSNMQTTQIASNIDPNIQYTVTVTDSNGCSASQSITLSQPAPLAMNLNYRHVTCFNYNNGYAKAIISGGTPPYSYYWLPYGTAGNVNADSTLLANTYTLKAYDTHGCNIDTTFTITQPQQLTYTYTTDSVKCFSGSDGSIILTTSGGSIPYAYTWNPGASNGSTALNIAAGTYLITIKDHNGCDTSASISVGEPPQLILSTSGNINICRGSSTIISATATGGTDNYTFSWNNGLGNGNSFTVSPATTTTYTVYVTDGNSCTSAPLSLTVFVSPPINVTLVANPSALCLGSGNVSLIASANGGAGSYIYTWGPGIGISTQSISVNPASTTMYYVTVSDSCGSPAGIDSVKVTVYPLPDILFSADTMNGCVPLGVIFADSTTPAIATWLWNFGDSASGANNISNQQNPVHLYITSGIFDVTLSATTTNGCFGSYTWQNMITVYPTPVAQFTSDPINSDVLNPIIHFTDHSVGAVTWNWNFNDPITGDSNISVIESPEHYFSNNGYYNVSLIVTSQYGCIDSSQSQIVIDPIFTFYMPNAFAPGQNGNNKFFFPKGEGWDLNNYQFLIYNRWGARVFETTNYSDQWDGSINGVDMAPQDVYVWMVVLKDFTEKEHTFRGKVTLIR